MTILRIGMAGVYLWFGFSQLFDGASWVAIVPEWTLNLSHLTAEEIIFANGLMEVVLGLFLAAGIFVRAVSLVLAIHLFIIAIDFGLTPTGVRDLGLSLATLSLAFWGKGEPKIVKPI